MHGVPDDLTRDVRRDLCRWIEQAWQIRDISDSEKRIPIHLPKGQLPPAWPYCKTYSIRLAQESGRMACSNPKCEDENGKRPRGRIEKNQLDGTPTLVWANGRAQYYYGSQEAS
ncbi:hypothetical protein ACWDRB_62930 [Nonomuraea sp. NPDC003707]